MAYYLDEKEVHEAFSEDERQARLLFEPFDEIERLAANKPKPALPAGFSNVTDGSLAAALRELPKRYLSQIFTGKVSSLDRNEAWVAEIANVLWSKHIVPNANQDDYFLNKQLDWSFRSNKYGSQPAYAFQRVCEGYAGADFVLPYIKNVIIEAGKVSDLAANRIYLVQNYDKWTLKGIIKECEKEEADAKKQKRESYAQWDAKQLKKLLDTGGAEKNTDEQNKTERDNSLNPTVFKIIHCFQRGSEAPFYSFAPGLDKDNIVRRAKNTNPTGDMPIVFLYSDVERENPYGMGLTALAGPNQNVQDFLTQAHMLATQIGLAPPIEVAGDRTQTDLKSLVWKSGKFWFTGNAKVQPVQNSNSIYSQFPATIGLYKTQQQNLLGSKDASVSSESGNPGFSKTQAGVEMQRESNGTNDGFLRGRHEQAFERLATTMINIHMANMQGTDLIKLLEDEVPRLQKSGVNFDVDENGRVTTDELLVEYENLRGKFKFEVDANSSIEKSDNETVTKSVDLLKLFMENPDTIAQLQASGYKFNTGEFVASIIRKWGLPDWEKIMQKLTPEEIQAQEQAAIDQQNAGTDQTTDTQDVAVDDGSAALEQRAIQISQTHGIEPELAKQVAQMEVDGADPEEIVNFVAGEEMGAMA